MWNCCQKLTTGVCAELNCSRPLGSKAVHWQMFTVINPSVYSYESGMQRNDENAVITGRSSQYSRVCIIWNAPDSYSVRFLQNFCEFWFTNQIWFVNQITGIIQHPKCSSYNCDSTWIQCNSTPSWQQFDSQSTAIRLPFDCSFTWFLGSVKEWLWLMMSSCDSQWRHCICDVMSAVLTRQTESLQFCVDVLNAFNNLLTIQHLLENARKYFVQWYFGTGVV